jgi:hypothetical protein
MKKLLVLTIVLATTAVWAESIELSTGEVIEGKLSDFPKDITVELSDGTKKKIPYQGISSIYKNGAPITSYKPFLEKSKENKTLDQVDSDSFEDIDATKGPYGTPTNTFETWKNAALKDDIDGMANCYAVPRKAEIKNELKKISKKTRQEMKLAMTQTIFNTSRPYFQGESAIMEVSWTKGLASQSQTLKFTLENNKDWKIVE